MFGRLYQGYCIHCSTSDQACHTAETNRVDAHPTHAIPHHPCMFRWLCNCQRWGRPRRSKQSRRNNSPAADVVHLALRGLLLMATGISLPTNTTTRTARTGLTNRALGNDAGVQTPSITAALSTNRRRDWNSQSGCPFQHDCTSFHAGR